VRIEERERRRLEERDMGEREREEGPKR